ncbi:MAG: hypothetical protein K2O34_04565, partial [Acetatifactor sp.]|nr:hypothetical protein [Acetatifactor sp.]
MLDSEIGVGTNGQFFCIDPQKGNWMERIPLKPDSMWLLDFSTVQLTIYKCNMEDQRKACLLPYSG